jgi:hypothetical protein
MCGGEAKTTWQGALLSTLHFAMFICCLTAMFLPFFSNRKDGNDVEYSLLSYRNRTSSNSGYYSYTYYSYTVCQYDGVGPTSTTYDPYTGATITTSDCAHRSSAAKTSGGFAILFHSIGVAAHFTLFIMYVFADCCVIPHLKKTLRAIVVIVSIGAVSLALAFFVSLGILTGVGASGTEGGFWWTFANVLITTMTVWAAYKYKGGKDVPPPNPSTLQSGAPTVVVVQGPNGTFIPVQGSTIPASALQSMQTTTVVQHQEVPMGMPMPVAMGPPANGLYSLLVHGVGNFPVKIGATAQTYGDLVMALKAQLGIAQDFIILYTDPEFGKTAQLRDISSLPQRAEITLQFNH